MRFLFLALLAAMGMAQAAVKLNGAGASFPYPLYSVWFSEFQKTHKDIRINYQAIGSGGGIRQIMAETVNFAGSDVPMKDKEKSKLSYPIAHIPMVVGALALTYKLEEVKTPLKLDGATIAKIYQGKITKWNDPVLSALNPGVSLPAKDILVIRRSDGSGSTAVFTQYLSMQSESWKAVVGTGKSVKWPIGVGAKGNDGVAGMVRKMPGAIGYLELAYALNNRLSIAAVKNKAGAFVTPSTKNISAAANELAKGALTGSILDGKDKEAYPISAFTYLLLPHNKKFSSTNKVLKTFIAWAFGEGDALAKKLHYAPIPEQLKTRVKNHLKKI